MYPPTSDKRGKVPDLAAQFAGLPGPAISADWNGAIALLGERLHGMQEVSGSIPLTSTTRFTDDVPRVEAKVGSPRPHRLEA